MIEKVQIKLEKYADQIGFTGSFFCLVHCILTSGLIFISSTVSHIHDGHDHDHGHVFDFWGVLDISMILVGGVAVYFASKKTHSKPIKWGLWLSYLVYATSMLIKYVGFEPVWLAVLSYTASFALIALHLANLKFSHSSKECDSKVCVS
ncbi:MerC domain-containing protein [Flammeovirga agarivorans]|uniref:MerC domain-containing protein n=1 Tax=Flammeovirga agarivorans TaxID=2726742 RepID=A0A7X8SGC6_9BACT|nr:MerC domain-containing protein [Flammeovirga agarivorans]NLR89577.1 MerC domain-containing protein [Flammeovirga agarivorans]